jgi:hypothetical protein
LSYFATADKRGPALVGWADQRRKKLSGASPRYFVSIKLPSDMSSIEIAAALGWVYVYLLRWCSVFMRLSRPSDVDVASLDLFGPFLVIWIHVVLQLARS